MPDGQTIQRCRWAEPTVFQKTPLWAVAEDYPWTCRRESPPHTVEDTLACRTCPRWEQRTTSARRDFGISEGW